MKPIRVGVIGVGHLGRYHALNYSQLQSVKLIGVADLDFDKTLQIAKECHCHAYKSTDDLLHDIEAVSICVPTDRHFDVANLALSNHVHLLIEKPITSTVEQADTLIRSAADQNLVLQVGHIERFNPAFMSLKGISLHPSFIESHRLAPFKPRGIEVSVVLDLMIHDIDLVLSMMSSPLEKVDASGVAVVSDTIDIANARLRFADGSVANLTASRISQKTMRKMRLFQKNTYITVDFHEKQSEIYELGQPTSNTDLILGEMGIGEKKQKVFLKRPAVPDHNALLIELETFIKTVQGQSVSGVTGESARKALSVAVEILSQMNQQKISGNTL